MKDGCYGSTSKGFLLFLALALLFVGTAGWVIVIIEQPVKVLGVSVEFLLLSSSNQLSLYYPKFAPLIWTLSKILLIAFVPIGLLVFAFYLHLSGIVKFSLENTLVGLISFLLMLGISELLLMLFGFGIGQHTLSKWVKVKDEIDLVPGFFADHNSVLRADTDRFPHFQEMLGESTDRTIFSSKMNSAGNHFNGEILAVLDEHRNAIIQGENPFSANQVSVQAPYLEDYLRHPINGSGFYSIPFSVRDSTKTRVMLLGDSFVWGHSADRKLNSFSNILLRSGHLVYNTGVSGADMTQYEQVLYGYMDSIRPEIVLLNFFLGNDLICCERKPLPHIPVVYNTTAGNILSFQNGKQFTDYKQAYKNAIAGLTVPDCSKFNRICSSTRLTSLIWGLFRRTSVIQDCQQQEKLLKMNSRITNLQVKRMADYCSERNTRFIVSVIPEIENDSLVTLQDFPELFTNVEVVQANFEVGMYNSDDGHFNDSGHQFYAEFLDGIIMDEFYAEK